MGKTTKQLFILMAVAAVCAVFTACGGGAKTSPTESPTATATVALTDDANSATETPTAQNPPGNEGIASGALKGQMVMQDGGVIDFELYPEAAPNTVRNFVELANSGYWDGTKIHRVVPNFVAQGGIAAGHVEGDEENAIAGEFAVNGWNNPLSHTRGVLSMARTDFYDSAFNQFFIVLNDAAVPSLDRGYAAFGKVSEDGMEVVDAFVASAQIMDDFGSVGNDIVVKTIRVDAPADYPKPTYVE